MLGDLDDFAEIFFSAGSCVDVFTARIAGRVGRKHTAYVRVFRQGWHNAVGGEKNRPLEGLELLALFPPCVAVIAYEVFVLLECRIIVRG